MATVVAGSLLDEIITDEIDARVLEIFAHGDPARQIPRALEADCFEYAVSRPSAHDYYVRLGVSRVAEKNT